MTNFPHELIFLKLGGSLITEKDKPHTARCERIRALAQAVARALSECPHIRLLLGHGSGSFGHVEAAKYGTRRGVHTAEEWRGFAEVWRAAQSLNRLVMDALQDAGVPAVAFPPSAGVLASDGKIAHWDEKPLAAALNAGLVAVTYGDVAFDTSRGGTIVSTEEVFAYLAPVLKPRRILIAGEEPGVWADYPKRTRVIPLITPKDAPELNSVLGGSAATDVTGGMFSKVQAMLALVKMLPSTEVLIFGGTPAENIHAAICGASLGTKILNAMPTA